MRGLATKLYQRVTNFGLAFMLAVSSLAAVTPLAFSQTASAADRSVDMTYFQTMGVNPGAAAVHFGINFDGINDATGLDVYIERGDGSTIIKSLRNDRVDDVINNNTSKSVSGYIFTKEIPGSAKYNSYVASNSSWERARYYDASTSTTDMSKYVQWTNATIPTEAWAVITTASGTVISDSFAFNNTGYDYPVLNDSNVSADAYYASGAGYTAIAVDVTVTGVNSAKNVEICVGDGLVFDHCVEAKQSVLNSFNESNIKSGGVTQSGPVVMKGSRTSGSWTNQTGSWVGLTGPSEARVVVTLQDGTQLTAHDSTIVENKGNTEASVFADIDAPSATLEVTGGTVVNGVRYVKATDVINYKVVASDPESGLDRASHIVFKLKANGKTQDGAVCGSWHTGKFPAGSDTLTGSFTMKGCNGGVDPEDRLYGIGFRVYDNAGNNLRIPNEVIVVDNTDAVTTITAPVKDEVINGVYTFKGTSTDVGGSGVDRVYLRIGKQVGNEQVFGSWVYPDVNGNWEIDVDTKNLPIDDGIYNVRARTVDNVGNEGKSSGSIYVLRHFEVDNTAPSVQITNPSAGFYNHDVEVLGTVTDDNLSHYWVHVTRNGLQVKSSTVVSSGIDNEVIYSATQEGVYTVTLAARDKTSAGGNRSTDVKVTFTIDKTAPDKPTNLSWLGDGGISAVNGFTNIQNGVLSWDTTTPGDVDHYVYKFWTNISGYEDDADNPWSDSYIHVVKTDDGGYVPTGFADKQGTYFFCVEAVDKAGNNSGCSDVLEITYDATAPVISLIGGDITIEAGSVYTEPGATATDNIDTSVTVDITGTVGITVGTYELTYTATDRAGNTSAPVIRTVNVVDTTAPLVTVNALTTTDTTPTLTGDVEDGTVEVIVTIGGVDYPATINLDGTWSLTLTSPLTVGTHAVVVSAKDASGNVGTANADVTVEEVPVNETETALQIVVTPQPTPLEQEVLGDQDDQTGTEGNTNEQGSSDVQAATDDKTGETYGANVLGLAWYWWLLILAAIVAAWWLIAGYLRRSSQES